MGDREGEIIARLEAMQRDESTVRQRSHDILSQLTAIKLGVEMLVDRPVSQGSSSWNQAVTSREISIAIASILGTIGVLKFFGKV